MSGHTAISVEIDGVFYESLSCAEKIIRISKYLIKQNCLSDEYLNYQIVPFRITYIEKKCTMCDETKPTTKFYKQGKGFKAECKQCRLERQKEYDKEYCQNNKKELLKYAKQYYQNNKEKALNSQEEWRKNNPEYQKEYRKNNREVINEKQRKKIQKTPILKLNRNIRNAIGRSLKGMKNGAHWESLVDYNLKGLIAHLESKFTEGMSWKNYGKGKYKWNVDHVIAICHWDITSAECQEFKDCWALKNLQPLWEIRNMEKGDKPMELKYLIKPDCIK